MCGAKHINMPSELTSGEELVRGCASPLDQPHARQPPLHLMADLDGSAIARATLEARLVLAIRHQLHSGLPAHLLGHLANLVASAGFIPGHSMPNFCTSADLINHGLKRMSELPLCM